MAQPEGIREDLWRAMRSARLWRAASDEDIEWLARVAKIVEVRRDDVLFAEGVSPDEVLVVIDGHARAVNENDGRTMIVETFWPGDVIGAVAALGNVKFESTIRAGENMTMASIPVGALKELLVSEPSIALSVISELARRWISVINATKRNAGDVTSRVALYLSDLPRTRLGGSAYAVEIPISRVELAATLGTTPESLSRAFHALQEAGLIESHDRMIIVPDGDLLLGRDDGERFEAGLRNG